MNVLPFDKQVAVVAALVDGCSIRAIERMTGIHRDTIMRLGARVGLGAIEFHDRTVHSLRVPRIELDEAWSYVGKKRRNVKPTDPADVGDQYVFIGMSSSSKAILSFLVGKRDREHTTAFCMDLADRIINAPEISTDGWGPYPAAIEQAFAGRCHYGQVEKVYRSEPGVDAARRYSPGYVVAVKRQRVVGMPGHISTSYVERQNLTLRMGQRRFTRLTNGFSKKLDHHVAAVGLYVAHYNFCRPHEAHKVTPAMAQGLTDHIWTIGELVEECFREAPKEPRKHHRRFKVIEGGRTD